MSVVVPLYGERISHFLIGENWLVIIGQYCCFLYCFGWLPSLCHVEFSNLIHLFFFVFLRVWRESDPQEVVNWKNHQIQVRWPCNTWSTIILKLTPWRKTSFHRFSLVLYFTPAYLPSVAYFLISKGDFYLLRAWEWNDTKSFELESSLLCTAGHSSVEPASLNLCSQPEFAQSSPMITHLTSLGAVFWCTWLSSGEYSGCAVQL